MPDPVSSTLPHITVYTTSWCSDCHALKAYLDAKGLPYSEVNIEDDPEAAELVMRVNAGRRSVPTMVAGEFAASLSNFSPRKARDFLTRLGVPQI